MKDWYYNSGYSFSEGGYVVKCGLQGDARIGIFICETDANDFEEYRNRMLEKHNTTSTENYHGGKQKAPPEGRA